jgi:hypothetical protein
MTFAVQPWVRRGLWVIHKMNEAETIITECLAGMQSA